MAKEARERHGISPWSETLARRRWRWARRQAGEWKRGDRWVPRLLEWKGCRWEERRRRGLGHRGEPWTGRLEMGQGNRRVTRWEESVYKFARAGGPHDAWWWKEERRKSQEEEENEFVEWCARREAGRLQGLRAAWREGRMPEETEYDEDGRWRRGEGEEEGGAN